MNDAEATHILSQPAHRPRPLALDKLYQDGVPFNARALAWSPDAELAVSTSDSVYIYVPQFTSAVGGRMPILNQQTADQSGNPQDTAMQDQADGQANGQFATGTETRKQFAAGVRRIPVGYPRPDHRINRHLFSVLTPGELGSDTGAWQDEPLRIYAGSGTISGSGSTMNSVVSIAWSPSGVGRNRRSILGVLTTSGMLTLYGEPLEDERKDITPADGNKTASHGRSSYDTSRWEILWAVGERLAVPGQKKTGECIVSFAWTGGCEGLVNDSLPRPGDAPKKATQAFLVYQTDKRDIVFLKVSHLRHGDGSQKWHVVETNRLRVLGPHLLVQPVKNKSPPTRRHVGIDPAFVPLFTPFGLRCSPWMVEKVGASGWSQAETTLTCVIGYMTPNYVGFRRLTVFSSAEAEDGEPQIYVDEQDCAGFCTVLSGNAMLEFEEGLWDKEPHGGETGTKKVAVSRCVVATPSTVETCEVEVESIHPRNASKSGYKISEHLLSGQQCPADLQAVPENHANPITGLVVHPPDPNNRGDRPSYTIVRQSATTRYGWFYGNASAGTEAPEWASQMQSRIAPDNPNNGGDGEQVHSGLGDLAPDDRKTYRFRIWGLDQAPGGVPGTGGITALLMTEYLVSGNHSGRMRERSCVLFGSQGQLARQGGSVAHSIKRQRTRKDEGMVYHRRAVSTEAQMWSYMYGNGPEVVSKDGVQDGHAEPRRGIVLAQTCSICEAPISDNGDNSVCSKGHQFDRCTATGLAIQKPHVSQACGVCGHRALLPGALEEMLQLSGNSDGDFGELRAKLLDKVCGFCGGKFYE